MGFDLGQGLKGFIGGGPIGGLLGGMFPGEDRGQWERDQYKDLYGQLGNQAEMYGGRAAPQAQWQAAADSDFRRNQENLIAQLERQARGEGPSVAEQQLKQATDQNTATQAALAASGRGNSNLASFNAQNQARQVGQAAAGQAAVGRVQEQLGALGMLGQTVQGARGQDLGLNTFNAGQQNQMGQFNAGAQLQQTGMNDQAQLQAYLAQLNALQGRAGAQLKPGTGDQILGGAGQFAGFALGKRGGAPGGGGQLA